jgi:hypothetical protein
METRQAAATKPELATSDCFFMVQGNRGVTADYVREAASELVAMTTYFCGGHARTVYPA